MYILGAYSIPGLSPELTHDTILKAGKPNTNEYFKIVFNFIFLIVNYWSMIELV
jgi:hypothetical protein